MKDSTKKRKKAIIGMQEAYGRQELNDRLYQILTQGKQGFDVFMKGLGRMMQRWLAAALLYYEKGFYRVRGHASISGVMATIDREQTDNGAMKVAA